MTPTRVFLDANVLFSAALGGEVFDAIRELSRASSIRLLTYEACVREALESLSRKRPAQLEAFDGVLLDLEVYSIADPSDISRAGELVGVADAHVLAAALALDAGVLVTGDRRHFGQLMGRGGLPIRVRTPRGFLLDGPG